MKKFLLIAVLSLTACVAQTQQPQDLEQEQDSSSGGIDLSHSSHGHEPGCPIYFETFYGPDGETFTIEIPALCNPIDIDKGDPPDDAVENPGEEFVNPDPMQNVNALRATEFVR